MGRRATTTTATACLITLIIFLSFCLSSFLSIYLSIYPSTHRINNLSTYPSIHPPIHPSTHPSIHLSTYLSIFLMIMTMMMTMMMMVTRMMDDDGNDLYAPRGVRGTVVAAPPPDFVDCTRNFLPQLRQAFWEFPFARLWQSRRAGPRLSRGYRAML